MSNETIVQKRHILISIIVDLFKYFINFFVTIFRISLNIFLKEFVESNNQTNNEIIEKKKIKRPKKKKYNNKQTTSGSYRDSRCSPVDQKIIPDKNTKLTPHKKSNIIESYNCNTHINNKNLPKTKYDHLLNDLNIN